MLEMQLVSGAPDEPATGDWDALGDTPGPHRLFEALFRELAAGLPDQASHETRTDDTDRVHDIWLGSAALGVRVTETESVESTMFPMSCRWETFGLPGMKLIWDYKLDHAGQLGYAAFRHVKLVCRFDRPADARRLAEVWQRVYARAPEFVAVTSAPEKNPR
jgi:hypothetical protein